MEPVYQCCYTNATQSAGNMATSGWQVTAASPDIPREALDACVRMQNANAALCAEAVDEQGNVLVLDEYCGDGSYLYVIRTQFGLSDRLGRPNMFSHAVIFPLRGNEAVLRNPNYYLALHPSTFAGADSRLTWEHQPVYVQSIDLNGAMFMAGLDRERYAALLRCVYAQMEDEGAPPLYIQYDGNPLRIRGLLHCICAGLPHYLVKTLRAASCPTANDDRKHLVFSRSARSRERYFVPQSGENTVLTPRVERKISRCGYVDHAALHLPPEEFPGFFDYLDRFAAGLGYPSASNSQVLKLAFRFRTRPDDASFSDEELESLFADALRLPPSPNHAVEWLLARMLRELNMRGLRLPPEGDALLDGWLSNTSSQDLREAGRGYKGR